MQLKMKRKSNKREIKRMIPRTPKKMMTRRKRLILRKLMTRKTMLRKRVMSRKREMLIKKQMPLKMKRKKVMPIKKQTPKKKVMLKKKRPKNPRPQMIQEMNSSKRRKRPLASSPTKLNLNLQVTQPSKNHKIKKLRKLLLKKLESSLLELHKWLEVLLQ